MHLGLGMQSSLEEYGSSKLESWETVPKSIVQLLINQGLPTML